MAVWARQVARCGWLRAAGLLGLRSRSGAARACCGAAPLPALLSGHRLPPWRLRVSVDCAQPSRAKGEACAPRSSLPVAVKQEQAAPETVSDLSAAKLYEDWDDVPPSSALEEISEEEAVKIIADPLLPPQSSTLRDYVDHSETLTKLVHLGVDLSQVEKRQKAGQLLLTLDFEKDITKILLFLKDVGIEDNQLGPFLTKNPYILGEDLEALETSSNLELTYQGDCPLMTYAPEDTVF